MKTPLNIVEEKVLHILERNIRENRGHTDTLTDIREFLRQPKKFLVYECLSCNHVMHLPKNYFVTAHSIPAWTGCVKCHAPNARYTDTVEES